MTAPCCPSAETPRPAAARGGIVLEVAHCGEFVRIWTVHPVTHAERCIDVHACGPMPEPGDTVGWWPGQSPGWTPRGDTARRRFLPRCGPSYDPSQRKMP
jgi:hypothetical protein